MANDLSDTEILVVDNPNEIRNIREILREAGFNKVSESSSSLTVLTEIKKNPPDLIMANYHLPKYSGLQLYKSITGDKGLASIKFVMTTPKLNRRELKDLEGEGVKTILQRPFNAEQLREVIFAQFGMGIEDMEAAAKELASYAKKRFDEKDYEEALKSYKEASDTHHSPEYYFMQGRCYLELDLNDQAIAALQNTTKLDPHFPSVEHWLGVALQGKDDHGQAVKVLERASKKPEATAETHVDLGVGYLNVDRESDADRSFDKAIELEPENIGNRTKIGNAYLEKGIYEKAEAAFGKALDLNPENVHLYNRMAIALRKQHKAKDAIAIYIRAIKVAPEDEGLFYNLARALYEDGQRDKAIKSLEKALSLDPEFSEAIKLKAAYEEK